MTSIFENNTKNDISFHILTEGLTDENQKKLNDIAKKYSGIVNIYNIDLSELKDCPIKKGDHVSIASYFRILIPIILPKSIKKVLYIDCDIVVVGELSELWSTDLSMYAIGACDDSDDIRNFNRLDYDSSLGYFNAGVLLMNLDYWREYNISNQVLTYINQNPEKLKYWDQDALNSVLKEQRLPLSLVYNVHEGCLVQDTFLKRSKWSDLYKAITKPIIIHYTGSTKPWHIECKNPFKEFYFIYKNKTIWSNEPLIHIGKNSIKAHLYRAIIKFARKIKLLSANNHNYYIDINNIDKRNYK